MKMYLPKLEAFSLVLFSPALVFSWRTILILTRISVISVGHYRGLTFKPTALILLRVQLSYTMNRTSFIFLRFDRDSLDLTPVRVLLSPLGPNPGLCLAGLFHFSKNAAESALGLIKLTSDPPDLPAAKIPLGQFSEG